jgi:hypothetical protein
MVQVSILSNKRIRQLKAPLFVRPRIEDHRHAGAKTLDLADEVHAKPAPFIESTRMRERMPAARFIDVKVNGLLANRTSREQWMKSPPA